MGDIFADLLASGVFLFGQGSRLLKLRFSKCSRLRPEALLPHRVHGEEGLSQNYVFTLECLSADTFLELKSLLGQAVEISLLLPDGGCRLLTGLVTAARHAGADGGFAKYALTIEPALATLAHRRNSRTFQDKTVPEIVAAILDEHIAGNSTFTGSFQYREALTKTYPVRSYCLQYRESDLAFIQRLLAEEGISYRYTHGADPDTSLRPREGEGRRPSATDGSGADVSDIPVHTLILFDSNPPVSAGNNGLRQVLFHRTSGVESDDAIDDWTATRAIQAGTTTLASYDYQAVTTHGGEDITRNQYGKTGDRLSAGLEDYDPQGAYYGNSPEEMARYSALRQQARDLATKTFTGQGTVRALYPGSCFELLEHPVHDQDNREDRQFLVTALTFDAVNNLTPNAGQSLGRLLNTVAGAGTTGAAQTSTQNTPPYRNTITAVRRHVPIVPGFSQTDHQKPTAKGMTTATVVGPQGEEIFTDEHGRIKIQFHWQRKQDHPDGGADLDDRSSTWVRVAMPSAGAAWGTQYIPRIGQEVVIDFLEGDIDRPLVTGVVYNGSHRPPTFSGAGALPANKTLSGHKSKEYKGSRYNELLFDDSTNEIRTKLSSEHGKTQLNQGYLIHPRTDGKGEARGEGFELRTDAAGAIRAAKGVLISAEERGHAVGKQLDRDMLLGQLQTAEGIAQSLSDLADQHGAEVTETDQQSQLLKHVENWEKGSNTASKENAAEGGKPVVALSGPLGIVAGTPESMTVTAGHNLDFVSVKHTNLTVGGKWLARVADSFSLFVHKLGMKLIAAGGHIDIQAQAGEIRISSTKKITLTSNEEIVLQAPKVTAIAQGAQIDMGGGAITTQCSGKHEQKAARHELTGPGGGTPTGAFNPKNAAFDQKVALTWIGTGEPIQNRRYRLTLEDGRALEGVTDEQGNTETLQSDLAFARYSVELLSDPS